MQDSKDSNWKDGYATDSDNDVELPATEAAVPESEQGIQDGWQQYRRWISKAPAPRGRRSGLDPSLYTWKGYRSWTEQIKRNWSDN